MPLLKVTVPMLNEGSIPANSVSASGTTVDLTRSVQFAVTATVLYAAAGVLAPAIVELYSSVDGGIYDTLPYKTLTLDVPAGGGTVQASMDVPASVNYIKAEMRNTDQGIAITNCRVDGVKQDAS
jgi:hypothetical protein